jgi:hypothetical protein
MQLKNISSLEANNPHYIRTPHHYIGSRNEKKEYVLPAAMTTA